MNSNLNQKSLKVITRKEQFLQIYLPLIIFTLIMVGLSLLVILLPKTRTANISHWGNISTLVLILPLLVVLVVIFAITALIIFGMAKLIKWLPIHATMVYVFFMKVELIIINISNKLVAPIIHSRSIAFSIRSIFKKGS